MKNRFRNISYFLDLDYFEKIKISIIIINYGNFDFFKIIQILKVGYISESIFHAKANEAGLKVRKLTVFKQRSIEVVEYAGSINYAKSTVCIKFQLLVTFSSLFTGSSSLSVFPRSVLYVFRDMVTHFCQQRVYP